MSSRNYLYIYLVFIFFFLSGFCSLVYQVTWLRPAMAGFGVTSTMIAVVLSGFMAGLSLGSWDCGRIVSRFTAGNPGVPLRIYAILEAFIGIFGQKLHQLPVRTAAVQAGSSLMAHLQDRGSELPDRSRR